jgi:lysyl-tRNA synthetase class 1
LDSFGFEYEFQSATDWYKSGRFDDVLKLVFDHHEEIKNIILPTLGQERRDTYSPFLPICPKTGVVLQVSIIELKKDSHTIVYKDPNDQRLMELPITGGNCKLQWKADWGTRWRAFDVDYEMSGKDLIDSVKLSSEICRVLGGRPPINLTYELFLDEQGQKISKSKGNGLTIDEWLAYAPRESLSYYMFQAPKRAKRLYFDVIPKAVDEYMTQLEKYHGQDPVLQVDNPVFHIHGGTPPKNPSSISFNILLNLASVCNAEDPDVLWGFVKRYMPNATKETMPKLNDLIGFAVTYFNDFVKPSKVYRTPTDIERAALDDLKNTLSTINKSATAEEIQFEVFEVGKRHGFTELRQWFGTLYEVLLGQKEGPRMGTFIGLYGIDETIKLIEKYN